MELIILLDSAITSIQNLENYYVSQIDSVTEQAKEEAEKYSYGVLLERFFYSKIFENTSEANEIIFDEEDEEILENILDTYNVQQKENMGIVQYKIKNRSELEKKYELNPHKALLEYSKLVERPEILNNSTIMMLLVKYEEAISELLKYLINKYPNAYFNDKTITYAELISMNSDIKDIKKRFVEKEVEEIMRQPLSDWYKLFVSKHKAEFDVNSANFNDFKEIYYRRNLVVHNQNIVNESYLSNIKTNLKKGEKIEIDKKYLTQAFKLTEMVIYDTFWALKKVSNAPVELQEVFFNRGFRHMLDSEWELSEHIYKLLKEEQQQNEADKICNMINYWISVKNQSRMEEILREIQEFDISATNQRFKVAKYALLDDYDNVSRILENTINNEVLVSHIEQWPLFIQYRESESYKEFRNKHKSLFEVQDYQPDYLSLEADSEDVCEEIE